MFGFFYERFALELKRNFGNVRRLIGYPLQIRYHFQRGGNVAEVARNGVLHKQNFKAILLDFPFGVVDVFIVFHNLAREIVVTRFKRGNRLFYGYFRHVAHIDKFYENFVKFFFVFCPYAHYNLFASLFQAYI